MNLGNYEVKKMNGEMKSLSDYKGKVVLVVNTATECGFTPQYAPLEEMYKRLKEKGFEILDFPCNQFGSQAPGSGEEIHEFCTGRFGITFEQFAKIDVNGENAIPLYKDLVQNTKFCGFDMKHKIGPVLDKILGKEDKDYTSKSNIKWNFTKFLFDKEGNLIKRYEPTSSLKKLEKDIEELL
jgi:glutathione peroxidase